jgi:hypothetical protein
LTKRQFAVTSIDCVNQLIEIIMIQLLFTATNIAYISYKGYEAYSKDSTIPLLEAYSGLGTVAQYIPVIGNSIRYLDEQAIGAKNDLKSKGLLKYIDQAKNTDISFNAKSEIKDAIVKCIDYSNSSYSYITGDLASTVNEKLDGAKPFDIITSVLLAASSWKFGISQVVSLIHQHNILTDGASKSYIAIDYADQVIESKLSEKNINKTIYSSVKAEMKTVLFDVAYSAHNDVTKNLHDYFNASTITKEEVADYIVNTGYYTYDCASNSVRDILYGQEDADTSSDL